MSVGYDGKRRKTPGSARSKLRAFLPGQWFMMPRSFLLAFKPSESLLLAFLIDAADHYHGLNKQAGWFYFTTEKMENQLLMKRDMQWRLIKRLETIGVVSTRRMGQTAKRWIRINVECLERITDAAMTKFEAAEERRRLAQTRRMIDRASQDDDELGYE
jgi:hypothetical protein